MLGHGLLSAPGAGKGTRAHGSSQEETEKVYFLFLWSSSQCCWAVFPITEGQVELRRSFTYEEGPATEGLGVEVEVEVVPQVNGRVAMFKSRYFQ